MVEATGVSLPLAAEIIETILKSGASEVETRVALGIVDLLVPTLRVSLLSENAASPDLFPRES